MVAGVVAAVLTRNDVVQPLADECNGARIRVDAINLFRRQLDKDGDQWRILKTITASPKPIGTEPPDSVCPRCGMQVWAGRTRTERAENFKRNPYPLYCLTCGQRFKYEADGALAYTANVDTEKWTKRLTKENASQPDLTAVA